MKHWKTNEEMGEGFQYNKVEHFGYKYNSLIKTNPEDNFTMRTKYIIQDIWSNEQIKDLIIHCKQILQERNQ
jgi:hypothetical protein|tara:strand:+ start:213 stop:428 length:216 start_codon:yes stop_codon:yes gene_type:complete